jgi:hypothetical protein
VSAQAQHSRNQTPKRIHHKDTKSPRKRRNMLTTDFTDYTDYGKRRNIIHEDHEGTQRNKKKKQF